MCVHTTVHTQAEIRRVNFNPAPPAARYLDREARRELQERH